MIIEYPVKSILQFAMSGYFSFHIAFPFINIFEVKALDDKCWDLGMLGYEKKSIEIASLLP